LALEARKRLERGTAAFGDRVANLGVANLLDVRDQKPTSPTPSSSASTAFGVKIPT
jgi:hypothetical protein